MFVGRQVRRRPHWWRTLPFPRTAPKDCFMTITPFTRRASTHAGLLAATMALLIVSGAPLRAQDKDPVVAKVNGTEIRQSDLALAEEEAGQIPPMPPEAKRDYLVQFWA